MGSIIVRRLASGELRYQGMVKIPGAKAAVRTFKTREEAQSFIDDIESRREDVKLIRSRRVSALMTPDEISADRQEQWRNAWLKDTLNLYRQSDRIANYSKQCTRTIIRFAGDVRLGEIDRKWIRDYIDRARKHKTHSGTPYAWNTIVNHMRVMGAALKWRAEELQAKGESFPFTIKMVPQNWEVKRDRRLDPEEERLITRKLVLKTKETAPDYLRVFRLALNTAARLQEIILAEWSEFDLDRRYWIIPAKHTKCKKTRMVPLNKRAIRALRVMEKLKTARSPRVFHRIASPSCASQIFSGLFKRLGIKGLRFHDFRHEAISRMVLIERRLSVFEIMNIVGHSSLDMLERYTNLRGDELADKLMS